MFIYLDTRDLCDALEDSTRFTSLRDAIQKHGHWLVASYTHMLEMYRRVYGGNRDRLVTKMFLDLEKLPLRWVDEDLIFRLEIAEAVSAFSNGRDYNPVYPFVERFAETLPSNDFALSGHPNISPAEWCWEHYQRGADPKGIIANQCEQVNAVFTAWRGHSPGSVPRVPFEDVFRNLGRGIIVAPSSVDIKKVAEWVQKDPSRCPGLRVFYEVFHVVLRNKQVSLRGSDFQDSAHVRVAPYVDLITLDNAMRDKLSQAGQNLAPLLRDRVCVNLDEVMKHL